jgi:hypothetical protein
MGGGLGGGMGINSVDLSPDPSVEGASLQVAFHGKTVHEIVAAHQELQ